MGQVSQLRRVAAAGPGPVLEVAQEFARQFREQRGAGGMFPVEVTYEPGPALRLGIRPDAPDDRKVAGEHRFDVVEEQLAVDLQAARLDAFGRGRTGRVADVVGECALRIGSEAVQSATSGRV